MSNENNVKEEIIEEVKENANEEAVNVETSEQNTSENNDNDYIEVYKAQARAGYISGIVALLFTIVFLLVQHFIDGTTNYFLCATVFGMLAAENIVLYSKLKGRRNLILSILYTLFAIGCTVWTIVNLLK